MDFIIALNNITKKYDDKTVLSDICVKVPKGQIFGLLGPSGAGKTTIIKILTGQLHQFEGEAKVFGIASQELGPAEYSNIGMVMDNCGIYERLTAYDNLYIFAQISNIDKNRIHEILKEVELIDVKNKAVSSFSKGMKQRLVLARAMLHKPKMLFLDEPTSGLDPATAEKIHEMIYSLRDKGTTIFLTTHNMEEATKLCDDIALLHQGKIIESGTPREICRRYDSDRIITIILKDKTELKFVNDSNSADDICKYLKANSIISIHSSEPNLETVFIKLTGRKLV